LTTQVILGRSKASVVVKNSDAKHRLATAKPERVTAHVDEEEETEGKSTWKTQTPTGLVRPT